MPRQAIVSPNAPKAIGPYSAALRAGQLLFVSGQVPLDPDTGMMIDGDIGTQTRQVLSNIGALLEAGGLSMARVVRTTVYPGRHERLRGDERGRIARSSPNRIPPAPPYRRHDCRATPASRSTSSPATTRSRLTPGPRGPSAPRQSRR